MSAWFHNYGFAEVFPDLFVGAYPLDASDVAQLTESGVRQVLNLVEDSEYPPGSRAFVVDAFAARGLTEQRIGLTDFGRLPRQPLDAAVDVLLGWMRDDVPGYVHCRAGWQRSAAIAIGAVAVFNEVDLETSLAYVQHHKPSVQPLPEQLDDLADWFAWRIDPGDKA